ncbi:hypothetical protein KC352_g24 [Hortaea werneckii]|nr:hypothetical protein KC352_g24 [Hortaea werneckii]
MVGGWVEFQSILVIYIRAVLPLPQRYGTGRRAGFVSEVDAATAVTLTLLPILRRELPDCKNGGSRPAAVAYRLDSPTSTATTTAPHPPHESLKEEQWLARHIQHWRRSRPDVLRWGALAFGVFYGFSHQSAINSRDRSAHAQHEYERKEKLIQQARDEWQRKTQPQSGSGVISNPEDPNFDLEKYLQTRRARERKRRHEEEDKQIDREANGDRILCELHLTVARPLLKLTRVKLSRGRLQLEARQSNKDRKCSKW